MNHSLRGAALLLLQLLLVGVLPLVHASQESAELRQGPALAAESSGAHGGTCVVCALLSAPKLSSDESPGAVRSALLLVSQVVRSSRQPQAAPSFAFGARAPPLS